MLNIKFIFATLLTFLIAGCGGENPKLKQADGLRKEEKYAEALALYQEILTEDAGMKEAISGSGICKLYTGDGEGSLADLTQAIEISGEAKYADREDYNTFRGIDYFYRGLLYSAMGNAEKAVSDFEMAVKYEYDLVESHTQLGIALGSNDQPVEAVAQLTKALDLDPRHLPALTNRAYYLSVLGDNGRSLADYDVILEINPNDKASWVNRGYTYLGEGKPELALADIERSLELDPDYLAAVTYKGIALQHLGRNEDALQAFTDAIAKYPEYQKLWYGRGVTKVQLGDIAGACEDLAVAKSFGDIEGEGLRLQYCQ